MNLRNHRKVLVVDGVVAFAGGINIRPDHMRSAEPHTRDVHARFEGPIVTQLVSVFREDWVFATHERLAWVPAPSMTGAVVARAISDGPDEDLDRARSVLLAAIATARTRIAIATPYFLPDPTISKVLQTAARRGVRVDVVLPAKSNLRLVGWAMDHAIQVGPLRDVTIWRTAPPFDHSKLMVVDDAWCFLGSANWDPRSLRLNFELNVECYDRDLAPASDRSDRRTHRPRHRALSARGVAPHSQRAGGTPSALPLVASCLRRRPARTCRRTPTRPRLAWTVSDARLAVATHRAVHPGW